MNLDEVRRALGIEVVYSDREALMNTARDRALLVRDQDRSRVIRVSYNNADGFSLDTTPLIIGIPNNDGKAILYSVDFYTLGEREPHIVANDISSIRGIDEVGRPFTNKIKLFDWLGEKNE